MGQNLSKIIELNLITIDVTYDSSIATNDEVINFLSSTFFANEIENGLRYDNVSTSNSIVSFKIFHRENCSRY